MSLKASQRRNFLFTKRANGKMAAEAIMGVKSASKGLTIVPVLSADSESVRGVRMPPPTMLMAEPKSVATGVIASHYRKIGGHHTVPVAC